MDDIFEAANLLIYETVRGHLAGIPRLRHYRVNQFILSTTVGPFEITVVPTTGEVQIMGGHIMVPRIPYSISVTDRDFDILIARVIEQRLDRLEASGFAPKTD